MPPGLQIGKGTQIPLLIRCSTSTRPTVNSLSPLSRIRLATASFRLLHCHDEAVQANEITLYGSLSKPKGKLTLWRLPLGQPAAKCDPRPGFHVKPSKFHCG